MINLPPGAQIPVNFLTDPAITHRKITFPPQAPVNVNFPTPACIKAQSSHVHSSSIPDILGMTSPSTACAFTPQPSASTQHRDALQPRVKKRRARVLCIKLSPAQAKVKKRSYAAINKLSTYLRCTSIKWVEPSRHKLSTYLRCTSIKWVAMAIPPPFNGSYAGRTSICNRGPTLTSNHIKFYLAVAAGEDVDSE
jgi:hypothetical protein